MSTSAGNYPKLKLGVHQSLDLERVVPLTLYPTPKPQATGGF